MRILIIILSVIFTLYLSATIINIPADQPTIQEGINIAVNGDTVLVQPGTYFENIDFIGKGVTVGSLFLTTQDTSYITQTIIDGNQLIFCVTFSSGEDSSSVLSGLTITNGNFINGGGIFCIGNSSPSLLNLIVTENNGDNGGGISCNMNSNPLIKNVVITNNTAHGAGGINCFNSSPILRNVLIANNFSTYCGGAMYLYENCNPILENVTIANNQAQDNCGGIYCYNNCNPILTNCILWWNSPYEITFNYSSQPNSVTVSYSDITGGEYGINTNDNGTVYWMQGNIYADPLFVDELNGNYYLSEDSPCIDAGNPEFPNDPDGTISDMGAYYFNQNLDVDDFELTFINNSLSNYPNPFNPSTTIDFSIQKDSKIEISIYNIKGQKVRTLADNDFAQGSHSIIWNGDDDFYKSVSSGIYFYELNINSRTEAVKKCLLLK